MPYNAVDQMATGSNLYDTGVTTAKFPMGLIIRGLDQALGGGEFMYVQFNGTVAAGDVCSINPSLASGNLTIQAIDWAGAANGGLQLGVALAAQVASNFGWLQVAGVAVINTSGAVAVGDRAFWQAAGVVFSTLTASKQALGLTCMSVNNATVTGYGALGAQKALYLLNNPQAQGSIT